MKTNQPAVTGEGNAPRDYKRDFENLLTKVNDLRRAWIAPHRFSEQKASLQLAELADYYDRIQKA